jgi:uncharacterized protein YndB with AHSA1/START domain
VTELRTSTSGKRMTIIRDFAAPRQLVYDAFTDPDQLVKWWGPKGFTTKVTRMDVRPGGTWHYCMQSPEWGDSWGLSTYREVTPPERIVYSDAFSDAEGTVNQDLPVSVNTVTFHEDGGRTTLTIVTDYASKEDLKKVLEMGVVEGMASQNERLDELLAVATSPYSH